MTEDLVPVGRGGQCRRSDAEDVDRGGVGDGRQEISARDASPAKGFVDHHRSPRKRSAVPRTRVGNPVFDHLGPGPPVVPHQRVEVRDMHDRDPALLGERVPAGHRLQWRIVFDEHRGHIDPCPQTAPQAKQVDLLGPLQNDHVELLLREFPGRDGAGGRRPCVGGRQTTAVGSSVRCQGNEHLVAAVDERRRPGAVDMPHEHFHATTRVRVSTAARTSRGPTERRHG